MKPKAEAPRVCSNRIRLLPGYERLASHSAYLMTILAGIATDRQIAGGVQDLHSQRSPARQICIQVKPGAMPARHGNGDRREVADRSRQLWRHKGPTVGRQLCHPD